ncbi:MAG: Ig-like domain-containing protein, partial [Gemmatimonadota bacterium]|nr:Ig-like domain-containing protein [Gemmatimonadota bacterium]
MEARAVDPNTGATLVFGVFRATPKPDVPVSLAKVAGDAQQVVAGSAATDSLRVRVADQYNNPVPNVAVTWSVTPGSGSINPSSSTTGATGLSSTKWILGPTAGAQSVAAASQGLTGSPETFNAVAIAG